MPAAAIVPLTSEIEAPAAATAQSPTRRSTFSYALPESSAQRDSDLDEHLRGADRCAIGASVELAHPEHAVAGEAADHRLRTDRRARGDEILGRVGLAERAADRAPVSDHGVGDHALGVVEDREPAIQQVGFEQSAVPGHRADSDLVVVLGDVAELVG